MALSIKRSLFALNLAALKCFSKALGLPGKLGRKNELIEALVKEIEVDLPGVLQRLTETESRVLAEVAHNGGTYQFAAYKAKYSEPFSFRYPDSWSQEANLVWMFCAMEHSSLVMPPVLAERIRGVLPKPATAEISALDQIATEIPDEQFGRRLVHIYQGGEVSMMELKNVLRLVRNRRIGVNPETMRPTMDSERALSAALIQSDFKLELPPPATDKESFMARVGGIRSHAWGVLVQQCGWCKAVGGALELTEAGIKMLSHADMDDFPNGLASFLDDDDFDELNRLNYLRFPLGRSMPLMTRPSERRRAICRSMRDWPQGKWISIREVLRFIVASGNGFRTYGEAYSVIWDSLSEGDSFYRGEYFDRIYLRAFLVESLGTLGLVDLAYVYPHYLWPDVKTSNLGNLPFLSRYDGLLYVRLNDFGSQWLNLTDTYGRRFTDPKAFFRVLPNYEIFLVNGDSLPPSGSKTLNSVAKRISEFVWKIDRDIVLGYLEYGGKIKELVRFLEDRSVEGIPENVRSFLDDVGSKAASVTEVEEALVIEFADEHVAAEIAGDRRTSAYCKMASGKFVAVSKRDLGAFRKAARKLGYIVPP